MNRWIPQPSSGLICSLLALCTGLLFIIIILIVTITRQGVDQTEQNMEVKLRNLSLGVDSRVEKLSQDDSRMMEKLTDIGTYIKDMRASSVITKINGVEASVNRILSDDVTASLGKDIQRILEAITGLRDEVKKENSQRVDQIEQNMEVKLRNITLGLDSRMEKLSQDDSRMMEKLTDIETFIKDMKGQWVDQIEQNMEMKLRNLTLGLDSRMEKLSQDDSRMMEKLTDIETFIKDMKDAGVITKIKGMEASVNRILSDDVTGSLGNDIQRILGAIAGLRDEIRKENSSTDPMCEVGWKHYTFNCYYFSQIAHSWESAKKDCETKKAHLVVINGQEENTFLYEFSQYRTTWIGLTDVDGSWKWVDGTSYDATPKFWSPGQPDNWFGHGLGGGEDCAHLKSPKVWNDDHCTRSFPYICERKMS
ncbi:C-type lectin domain family 4 member K-like isoform X2 [Lithobates pipiens]